MTGFRRALQNELALLTFYFQNKHLHTKNVHKT